MLLPKKMRSRSQYYSGVLVQGFDLQEFIQGLQEHVRNLLFARIPGALETRIELETDTIQNLKFLPEDFLKESAQDIEIIKKAV